MEIYLIRHTKVNIAKDICYGQSDVSLAETFEAEFQFIQTKINDPENFICYTSPLTRCKTFACKLSPKKVIVEPRLMELNFGDWELKSWDSIGKQAFDSWHSDFVNNTVPGGESYLQLSNRVISFVKEITENKENTILVTHGGVIRALLSYFSGLPLENSFRFRIDYGGITRISLDKNFTSIDYVNF